MKRVLKWIGIVVAGLLGLVILLGAGAYTVSASRLNRTYEVTADFTLNVPTDPESIAAGEKLAATYLCGDCHGANLAGQLFVDDPTFGQIYSANLTAGENGIGAAYSDEEIAQAIWYGVKADGAPTVGMPPEFHQAIHIGDMEKLIAYLRTVPPVDTNYPPSSYGPMMRVMHTANMFPLIPAEKVDASQPPLDPISPDETLAYGAYLAAFCAHCHMADFAGDTEMFQSPNITPAAIGDWTEAEFVRAVTEGVRPDGTLLDPELMPWEAISRHTDEELQALWAYLQTVEPVPVAE
ncbi:MAG: c-type cytochrome [Candidatus Promineifilaceae bacterium]